jgi:hypothetical protein
MLTVNDVERYRENATLMRQAAEPASGELRIRMMEIAALWDDLACSTQSLGGRAGSVKLDPCP